MMRMAYIQFELILKHHRLAACIWVNDAVHYTGLGHIFDSSVLNEVVKA